jgi:hypothetical protein
MGVDFTLKPKYLAAGHYHHIIGPEKFGTTKYFGLNVLIAPKRKDKTGLVQEGSIAVLDTNDDTIEFVKDNWLSKISRDFDFISFIADEIN